MGRALLLSLLLVGSGAAAQPPSAPPASKQPRLPPIEGITKPLPMGFDRTPVLRYDEDTDCHAYSVKIALQTYNSPVSSNPAPAAARPDEHLDGCFIIRRQTADPFTSPGRVGPDALI